MSMYLLYVQCKSVIYCILTKGAAYRLIPACHMRLLWKEESRLNAVKLKVS